MPVSASDNISRSAKARRGASAFEAGRSAERIVARLYEQDGYKLIEDRWRGRGGEIDLIFSKDGQFVFVEVKRARSAARAAERISVRQMARIAQAAEEYAGSLPQGLLSEMRIDAALVDGQGRIFRVQNAFGG